jgi:MOSC domain-containing protein YiiM
VEVTLIESEEIDRYNHENAETHDYGEFRRNIVTQGVRLNDLVGKEFHVGPTLLEGIRLCEPCTHLAKFISPNVVSGMAHKAGLRARVVHGGVVYVNDSISE